MARRNSLAREARGHRIRQLAGWTLIAVAVFVSLVMIKPSLPKSIVLLTGPEGSSYHAVGTRYARELRRRGLATEVRITDGGLDNLGRLAAGGENAVAFFPSNLEHATDSPVDVDHLVSLGSVGFEPLWFFYRSDLQIREIRDLAVLTVASGDRGTVLHWMVRRLLEIHGIGDAVDLVEAPESTAADTVEALQAGSLDGVFAMGIPGAPAVERLLHADGVTLLSFNRADAYVARTPGLTKLVAPAGVFDLARDVPPEDTELLAATTNLVGRDSLHPAVVPVLLSAAAGLFDEESFFATRGTFPSPDGVSLPLDRAAARFYQQGESGLAKHVPYAIVRHLNHFGYVVLPMVGLAVALAKFLPVVLRIWTSLRLTALYKKLEEVEKGHAAGTDPPELLDRLDKIDQASSRIFVPRSKLAEYIDFRQFLHDMRERIAAGSAG